MDMKMKLAFAFLALLAAAPAAQAAISDPVKTDAGQLSGVTLKSGVRTFKGIPFAKPPVGDLRWRDAQPPDKWTGVRKMENFASPCVQNPAPNRTPVNVTTDLPDSPKVSEDCLYLNVWTQANRANDRRPVMFWIYGGAYTEGGGNSPHNDGENFAKKGVVLVNFNYRLGVLGFYAHPELTKESGRNASGNQALSDTIAALKWVKANIAQFGGDPNNVTIFGESAGAAMVGMLTGSPVAKGLYQKAIAESGAWMGLSMARMTPLATAEANALAPPGRGRGGRGGPGGPGGPGGGGPGRGAGAPGGAPAAGAAPGGGRGLGGPPPAGGAPAGAPGAGAPQAGTPPAGPPPAAPPADAAPAAPFVPPTLAQLRAMSTDEARRVSGGGQPVIDGWIIPEDLSLTFANGKQNPVDVIVGFNKDDLVLSTSPNPRARNVMAWHMRLFAEKQTQIGRKAYFYTFTHEGPLEPGAPRQGAAHASEIAYVFQTLDKPRIIPDRTSPKLASESAKDIAMADLISSYWVNFAKNGNPNGK